MLNGIVWIANIQKAIIATEYCNAQLEINVRKYCRPTQKLTEPFLVFQIKHRSFTTLKTRVQKLNLKNPESKQIRERLSR
jgi:hypothetical protein